MATVGVKGLVRHVIGVRLNFYLLFFDGSYYACELLLRSVAIRAAYVYFVHFAFTSFFLHCVLIVERLPLRSVTKIIQLRFDHKK